MNGNPPRSLLDHLPLELEELAETLGEERYRGRQIAQGIFGRAVPRISELTDLPRSLRERLAQEHGMVDLEPIETQEADDGTFKYLFGLEDGVRIECVAMPREGGRWTFCLSTQVGCRMACVFCATGRMGMLRQLSAGEIVAQVLELTRRHRGSSHPNLVFMGMGEPLDNFYQLERALRILTDPAGVGLGARRITVSSSGLIDGIRRLGELNLPVGLAISLTSADPLRRRQLMPVAGSTPLDELIETAAAYGRATRRRVTLECALIAGRNDDEEEAKRLLAVARRGPFKVNLIPLNPIEPYEGRRPEPRAITRMADLLWQGGVVTTVRDSAGREVDAACGQLVHRQRRPPRRGSTG